MDGNTGDGLGVSRIKHPARIRQVNDFKGLQFGSNIYPTDVDGLFEWHNQRYVILEFKKGDAPLPKGQRLGLTRLCDDLSLAKPTLLIIASHNDEGDVDAAQARVVEYRFMGATYYPPTPLTVRELMDRFIPKQ